WQERKDGFAGYRSIYNILLQRAKGIVSPVLF
ncbi:MAG: hypothetical protein ACI83W_002367, partial [Marinoscillum sp.]